MRFLRWWAGELTAAAEAVLAWIAPRRFKMLAVFVDRAEISAAYAPTKSDGQPLVVTARHGANAPLPAQPPSSWQSIVTRRPRTRLVLGMSAAYRHTFYLPLAALSQVASAAALQYPRLLPVSPDQLLLDYRRVQDHSAEAIVEFTLAALKRKDTELLVESLENWGLKVRDIQIGDGLVTTAPFHFAVPGRRARVRLLMPRLRPIDRWLLRSATALGVICLSLALTQQLRAEHAVILAEAAAREPASAVLTQQSAVDRMLQPLSFAATLQNEPGAAGTLREFTALLPQDSWITTLELSGHAVRVVGLTPDPTGLVKALSASRTFRDVQLRSSMSSGQGTASNRFEMTMTLRESAP